MSTNITVVHRIDQLKIGDRIVVVAPDWGFGIVTLHDVSERNNICITYRDGWNYRQAWLGEKTVAECFSNSVSNGRLLYAILLIESDEEVDQNNDGEEGAN